MKKNRVQHFMEVLNKEQIIKAWHSVGNSSSVAAMIVRKAVLDCMDQLKPKAFNKWLELPIEEMTIEKFFELAEQEK